MRFYSLFNLHVKTFVFSKFSLQLCLRGSFFLGII
nr:MAG TPA: hypothetical protein [Caudoviricetes sp.]